MSSLKIRIKLTNKCTNSCWYCSSFINDENEMSIETLNLILKNLKSLYIKKKFKRTKIALTGGNPFLYTNLIECLDLIKSYDLNHRLSIDTCYPFNLNLLEKYFKYDCSYLILSLNENELSQIEKLVKSIDTNKIFIFNVILNRFNLNRIDSILDFTFKYNLPLRMDHLFDPYDKQNNIPIIENKIDHILQRIKKNNFNYSHSHLFGNMYGKKYKSKSYCGYGENFYYFDVNGNIQRCFMELPVSNIKDKNFYSDVYIDIENKEKCKKCDVFSYCRGGCKYTNKFNLYCNIYKKIGSFLDENY